MPRLQRTTLIRIGQTARVVIIVVGWLVVCMALFVAIFLGYFGLPAVVAFVVSVIGLSLAGWIARFKRRDS